MQYMHQEVSGLVILLVKVPHGFPQFDAVLTPPPPLAPGLMHQLGAGTEPFLVGPGEMGEDYMDSVHAWMFSQHQYALSPVDLTQDDLDLVNHLAASGVSFQSLQRAFSGEVGVSPESAATHVEKSWAIAENLQANGNPIGAAKQLTRAGREHFYNRDFEGAACLMEAAINVSRGGLGNDPEAAYRVGQAYLNLRHPQAAAWYRKAIALGLDSNEPRFGLVDALMHAGEYGEALRELILISPVDEHEAAVVLVASHAFSFLVNDLGIARQEKVQVDPTDLVDLGQESLQELLSLRDATSHLLWSALDSSDPRGDHHFARAWFGDSAMGWLVACLALQDQGQDEHIPMVLALGLTRCVSLVLDGEVILDALVGLGLPAEAVRDEFRAASR